MFLGDYSDVDDYLMDEPIKETVTGSGGIFTRAIKIYRKKLSVKEFKKLALSVKYKNPRLNLTMTDLER